MTEKKRILPHLSPAERVLAEIFLDTNEVDPPDAWIVVTRDPELTTKQHGYIGPFETEVEAMAYVDRLREQWRDPKLGLTDVEVSYAGIYRPSS